MRRGARLVAAVFALLGVGAVPSTVRAFSPYAVSPPPSVLAASPAHVYANMSDDEAFAELDRRGVPYVREGEVRGVRSPIRLAGPLHGVHIHSVLPEEARASSVFEILDARLALSLDDFAVLLERHDVVELVHYTMFRPNVAKEEPPPPRVAKAAAPEDEKPRARDGKPAPGGPSSTVTHPEPQREPASSASRAKDERHAPARSSDLGKKGELRDKAPRQHRKDAIKGKAASRAKLELSGAARDASPAAGATTTAPQKTKPQVDAKTQADVAGKAGKRDAKVDAKAQADVAGKAGKRDPKAPATHKGSELAAHDAEQPELDAPAAPAPAPRTKRPRWAPPGTRHPAGLAIDLGALRKRDGTWLSVAQHFGGRIGAPTCGPASKPPTTGVGAELWAIVCEAASAGLFTYVLSPNYDADHADHFHMEIKGSSRVVLFQ